MGRPLSPCPVITPSINTHSKEEQVIYTKCIILNHCSLLSYPTCKFSKYPQSLKEKTHFLYYRVQSWPQWGPFPGLPRQASFIYSLSSNPLQPISPPSCLCFRTEHRHQCCSSSVVSWVRLTHLPRWKASWGLDPYPAEMKFGKWQEYLLFQTRIEIPAWPLTSLGKLLNLSEPLFPVEDLLRLPG